MKYEAPHQLVFKQRRGWRMTRGAVTTLAALALSASTVSWAADNGAALYKKKCAACHGAGGEGKPAIKAPALKGTTLEASQLTQHITKGEAESKAPHNK